jgi:hypothetical protein
MTLVDRLRLLSGYHTGVDLAERLSHAMQGQAQQREALAEAADEIERLHRGNGSWVPISEGEPQVERVLVVRDIPGAARYVDVIVWSPEPESGFPKPESQKYVTHWMPLPSLPE